ncbi:hypothetical protein [Nocardioides sp.]|uniref:hypothetical protein n=1 Tax=Nocardioides sp. TaxID=35761 RepID=UPI001A345639|nr:hypothetical protein [Nocardioides sp.]MBJ7359044.1 hypothetical protein [Nocardioides sp.]
MTGVEAGRALCRLLADPARPYRAMWERRGVAYRGRDLNQAAVAKVVAAYLVDRGVLSEFEEGDWPRARRDWVRSRLSGALLTHLDLEVFMDAFAFDVGERDRLRHILESDSTPMFVPGEIRLEGLPDRSTYAVDRTRDEHVLGADGLPAYHRTTQTVRALADDVTACLYLFDADAVTVEVSSGGTADAPRQVSEGIWAVVLTLDTPLRAGESCDLTYVTTFDYREAPAPVLRRAALPHEVELEMAVSFEPTRLPAAVHLSTWATVTDPQPVSSVLVDLDERHRVSARWTAVRAGLVGFSWTW